MNQEHQLSSIKILVIIGFTLISFALTLGIVTYVIPNWVTYSPDKIQTGTPIWFKYRRNKGIFQECLADTVATITSPAPEYTIKNNCIDINIGQYTMQSSGISYWVIIKMRLSQIVLHGITLLFLLIILIMGMGIFMKWCCSFEDSSFYIKWRITLGVFSFIAFLCFAASSSLGTGLSIIENNSTYKTVSLPTSPFGTDEIKQEYGYMFPLSWAGTGITLLATILFFVSSHLGKNLELEKYKPRVVAVDNPAFLGEESKMSEPIFLKPSGSTYDLNPASVKANDTNSPGLLPRYNISTFG